MDAIKVPSIFENNSEEIRNLWADEKYVKTLEYIKYSTILKILNGTEEYKSGNVKIYNSKYFHEYIKMKILFGKKYYTITFLSSDKKTYDPLSLYGYINDILLIMNMDLNNNAIDLHINRIKNKFICKEKYLFRNIFKITLKQKSLPLILSNILIDYTK